MDSGCKAVGVKNQCKTICVEVFVMFVPFSARDWTGRIDTEDAQHSRRWHQQVRNAAGLAPPDENGFHCAPVVLGFACDAGVKRNLGRRGAAGGPLVIRKALSNLTCDKDFCIYDAGTVFCENDALEEAQSELARQVCSILKNNGRPIVIGGGHEVAWGSFLGAQKYLHAEKKSVGIVNFDAHFDLRNSARGASSGTPFRQCQAYCEQQGLAFNYQVFGINPAANTQALFNFAESHDVIWHCDVECHLANMQVLHASLRNFIGKCDALYVTICMDVFSTAYAPGVSAPAVLGMEPLLAIKLIEKIKRVCDERSIPLLLMDVAEMNPRFDRDDQTSKLAARLIYEVVKN